jgi:hypothetical protein
VLLESFAARMGGGGAAVSEGGPPFRLESTRGALAFSDALRFGGVLLAVAGSLALIAEIGLISAGSLAGVPVALPFLAALAWIGVVLARSGLRTIAVLRADHEGLELVTATRRLELVGWRELRSVEFRRSSLRFHVAREGRAARRRRFTIARGRADDFVRLESYFAERMEAAARL